MNIYQSKYLLNERKQKVEKRQLFYVFGFVVEDLPVIGRVTFWVDMLFAKFLMAPCLDCTFLIT